jgi:hypothetical protein
VFEFRKIISSGGKEPGQKAEYSESAEEDIGQRRRGETEF